MKSIIQWGMASVVALLFLVIAGIIATGLYQGLSRMGWFAVPVVLLIGPVWWKLAHFFRYRIGDL